MSSTPSASLAWCRRSLTSTRSETVQQIVANQAGYYGVERKEALSRSEKYLKQLDLWKTQRTRENASPADEAPSDDRPRVDA